jgi:membrane protein required for colicin V production
LKALDIVILLVLLYGSYSGYKKGLLLELFQTLGLFAAILLGIGLLDVSSKYLVSFVGKSSLLPIIAFVVVFFLAWFVFTKASFWVSKAIKKTIFGSIDGAAGASFGILKVVLIMSSLLFIGSLLNLKPPKREINGTFLYPVIKDAGPKASSLLGKFWPSMRKIAEEYYPKAKPNNTSQE